MKILVTGAAGFIGAFVCKALLERGDEVVGLDCINSYYDTSLKFGRLSMLGVCESEVEWGKLTQSSVYDKFRFVRLELENRQGIEALFGSECFDAVCNLAAQAGVRYSTENPYAYIDSNICGFINILEQCRHNEVKHLVYASSSSVYGLNGKVPFSESDSTEHPVSLYAATKKANEMMAHSYSDLYNIPTTGLRFFTVYGPWGRPDMSPMLFTKAILNNEPINVYNNGDMLRDFTYIDDIVEGVVRCIDTPAAPNSEWDAMNPDPCSSRAPYRIYNIGNSNSIKLMDYISAVENACGKEAQKNFMPMQPGDVYQTSADTSKLEAAVGFRPNTTISKGIEVTVNWYREFYKV